MWPFRRRPKGDTNLTPTPDAIGTMASGMASLIQAFSKAEIARLEATVADRQADREMAERARQARREAAAKARAKRRTGGKRAAGCRLCAEPLFAHPTVDEIREHATHGLDGAP